MITVSDVRLGQEPHGGFVLEVDLASEDGPVSDEVVEGLALRSRWLSSEVSVESVPPSADAGLEVGDPLADLLIATAQGGTPVMASEAIHWVAAKATGLLTPSELQSWRVCGNPWVRVEAALLGLLWESDPVDMTAGLLRHWVRTDRHEDRQALEIVLRSLAELGPDAVDRETCRVLGNESLVPDLKAAFAEAVRQWLRLFRSMPMLVHNVQPDLDIHFVPGGRRAIELSPVVRGQRSVSVSAEMDLDLLYERVGLLLPSVLSRIAKTAVSQEKKLTVHLGDGFEETGGALLEGNLDFAFCAKTRREDLWLIPDSYALETVARVPEHSFVPLDRDEAWADFKGRRCKIFWRGNATGPFLPKGPSGVSAISWNDRIRFCREASAYPDMFDCKVLASHATRVHPGLEHELGRERLLSRPVSEAVFREYMMYPDLDGWTSAWGAIRKFLALCVVIRLPSPWELHYHDRLLDRVNCLQVKTRDPHTLRSLVREFDPESLFEIAYAGHVMACEWLTEIAAGSWQPRSVTQR